MIQLPIQFLRTRLRMMWRWTRNECRTSATSLLRVLAPALMLVASPCVAADAVQVLDDGWRFQTGDDPTWAQPEHDDSDWKPIKVGMDWESQAAPDYNGFAWYRLHLDIPADVSLPQGTLRLQLGAIDDVDETWFNGEQIGATGSFPPDYGSSWSAARNYLVPERLVRPGEDNVIAVRVYDGDGRGGMVDGPYELAPATLGDLLTVSFDLGRGDGVFTEEAALPIKVQVKNASPEDYAGRCAWTVANDEGKTLSTQESPVKLP
ncbi:MAG: beta galactosidase jelly roll domain-containing protein, partial [Planctomycetota bacterium]